MDTALRNGGASAARWAALGEARMAAAEGVATREAREAFAEALKLDAATPKARFGLAIAKRQDGDTQAAIADLEAMLAAAPDAPYVAVVRDLIADWRGVPKGGDSLAGLPPAERDSAIKGMVDSLAERLKAGGGTRAEWTRLIRARVVLGEGDAARAALATARERLAQEAGALDELKALAAELGLEKAE
jgi:cytochrome c-type biogenesis protein CcmH